MGDVKVTRVPPGECEGAHEWLHYPEDDRPDEERPHLDHGGDRPTWTKRPGSHAIPRSERDSHAAGWKRD